MQRLSRKNTELKNRKVFALDRYDLITEKFIELVKIMERLRAPGGCPWDAKQTLTSLRKYIIEEAYELVDAIDRGELFDICEEDGDLLLQIVFVACVANEEKLFDITDVITAISEKLIRRHPHVFGDVVANDAETVLKNWELIKIQEKREKKKDESVIAGIPHSLPSVMRANRVQERAAKIGFDWPKDDIKGVILKIEEELCELKAAVKNNDSENITEELGDVMFSLINLSRHLGVDPEAALQKATDKFCGRFRIVEDKMKETGRDFSSYSLDELDTFWNYAKKVIKEKRAEI